MTTTVLQGGTVVNGDGMTRADVVIRGDRILEVADSASYDADVKVVDCRGRFILPGLIDVHSHADGLIFDEGVQRSLLRQGVTTVIGGQDGVSYAPGDGTYAREYFGAINGDHPDYTGGGVGALLSSYDGTTRLNVAYMVPAGTVRWEVCGSTSLPADQAQLERMEQLVADGLDAGAVGLSSGLDYVPGIFASAGELAALCSPVSARGSVYATHMRGGYEADSFIGIDEIREICAESPLKVHISHFHAEPHIVVGQLDVLAADGIDVTFDLYPYTRGCTLLSMPLLPPELSAMPVPTILETLADPAARAALELEWFPTVARKASLGPEWPDMITLAHVDSDAYRWTEGKTLREAASASNSDPVAVALDILRATELRANAVMAVRYQRDDAELGAIFSDERHLGGSDGIFLGGHPHPRARGSFARYLQTFVVDRGTWSWPEAVQHLSLGAAKRFDLGRRGRIAPGWVADLLVLDPKRLCDRATYENPFAEAEGVDEVFVAGQRVLSRGKLESNTPGMGLRRAAPDAEQGLR